jgi:hypothetical protein
MGRDEDVHKAATCLCSLPPLLQLQPSPAQAARKNILGRVEIIQ